MKQIVKKFFTDYPINAIIWIVLIFGIVVVVIRPFGSDMSRAPGDLGDARFNNYVLEHFFNWTTGQEKSFWDAPIFYPFPKTIAFSDSLLGSAPFYAIFRLAGFSRESAFQGWYCVGFILNYLAVIYVLSRLKLHPLASSAGAFLFTFGLPMLAQIGHPQLIYRFSVPLVCYSLWEFTRRPRLSAITSMGFWFAWQLYLSIYIAFFLFLLLVSFLCLLPLISAEGKLTRYLLFWPQKIKDAWLNASVSLRLANLLGIAGVLASVTILIYPYLWVSSHYGFLRSWAETAVMLPRLTSYFLSAQEPLWSSASALLPNPPMEIEHQLFVGIGTTLLVGVGLVWKMENKNRQFAFYNLWAFCFLFILTLNIADLSLYKLVYALPGFDSIRAVSRIILVMLWPLAVFVAVAIDQLLRSPNANFSAKAVVFLCLSLMAAESVLYIQSTYSKIEGLNRINELRSSLPQGIKQDSILVFASKSLKEWWMTDLDAMLLGQELSLSIMNGYSGNFPPGYGEPVVSCKQIRRRISSAIKFTGQGSDKEYNAIEKRVIPIGFSDCSAK